MNVSLLVLIVAALGVAGFLAGRARAMSSAGGDMRRLHSLPNYYGHSVLLYTVVPALVVMVVWLLAQSILIERQVAAHISPADIGEDSSLGLVMGDVRRVAGGLNALMAQGTVTEADLDALRADTADIKGRLAEVGVALGDDVKESVLTAAKEYRAADRAGRLAMTVVALVLALAGFAWSMSRIRPDFRARHVSERFVIGVMIASSLVAIATTLGIFLSLIFETFHFFNLYPAGKFFFSTLWNPQFKGGSDLGILPLLWGTLYVSLIALIVAVPIGLLSAIYLSEYASGRVRTVVKAADRNPRGHPDHRLRPVRADHRRPDAARLFRPAAWPREFVVLRDDGRTRDGDHGHPFRLVAVR